MEQFRNATYPNNHLFYEKWASVKCPVATRRPKKRKSTICATLEKVEGSFIIRVIKLNRVGMDINQPSSITSTLLLCLFMPKIPVRTRKCLV